MWAALRDDADAHAQRPYRPPRHRPWAVCGFACAVGGVLGSAGWWVVVCYAGLTFCYSALAAVLPALSTDLFGLPHAGVNYGFLALGQSVGTFCSPASLISGDSSRDGTSSPSLAQRRASPASGPSRRCGGSCRKNRIEKLRSCAEKRKWKKDCEKFVRNDLQIGPTSSIIKLCVVVPGEALKRERHGPVNARRQGRKASAARHQFVKRRV